MGTIRERLEGIGVAAKSMKAVVEDIAVAAGEQVRSEWIALARSKLHRTADQYVSSIGPVILKGRGVKDISVSVPFEPATPLAYGIEYGAARFDMREIMLTGDKKSRVIKFQTDVSKTGSGSGHISAPFARRKIAKAKIEKIVAFAARSVAGTAFGGHTTNKLAASMPQLKTFGVEYGSYSATLRINGKLRRRGDVWRQSSASRNTWHSRTILAGGKKSASSTVSTWRTISLEEGAGWIHPGLKARDFIGKMQRRANTIMKDSVTEGLARFADQLTRTSRVYPRTAMASAARAAARGRR